MKTSIQIRTADFEYINQEYDSELSAEEAVEKFHELKTAFGGQGFGISEKEMDAFVENQLLGKLDGMLEVFTQMSGTQVKEIQRIKRALKRIKAKNQVEHDIDLKEMEDQQEELINNS